MRKKSRANAVLEKSTTSLVFHDDSISDEQQKLMEKEIREKMKRFAKNAKNN